MRVVSPEYRSWQSMKNRCQNPRAKDYPYYGGRGIRVVPAWELFATFLGDMGPRPGPKYTLERSDGNRDYGPGNCIWATRKTQARNRRFIKRYHGRTTWEWAEHLGIATASFHMRLWRFRRGEITEARLFANPVDHWKLKCV